ncbi:iron-containing alcohol dehydrogenase [Clostridium fallax]|uniref:Uncharacterized protein n=1 Tax=Clostridium fallax TaxID=1533 RepID=A0A1M4SY38_9CLOT|nr:iron-containing alcohol dehydrogenase [Clostridium fallax]SHE36917.1 hypothetical protein SAMN05443638_101223 [Clostridium fallax]SQB08018.1 iron-containing alcohol dehydrogenase [Clostridium fallax]
MLNFTYCNPTKIIFGKGTIEKLGMELKNNSIKKVLFLYGKSSILRNGVHEQVVNSLKENNIEFIELSGVKPNPVLSKVREGIEIVKKNQIDGIVAVGGGSVIDSAKAISAGSLYNGDVWNFFEDTDEVTNALPIFTVLTISATGSEMNCGGVITNEKECKKWSFGSPLLYPKVSILDPSVQSTLPPIQTVNGAIDAISHVFELYFGGTKNTDMLDELSEGIIRNIMKHTKILLRDNSNYESRCELVWSATLALNGINGTGRAGDWSSHQIEHSLSVFNDISHGSGLAIIMPAWMEYVKNKAINKFARLGEKVFNITEGSNEEKASEAINSLRLFYKEIGAPTTLKEIGITKEDLITIAVNAGRLAPIGTLTPLKEDDILKILELAFE